MIRALAHRLTLLAVALAVATVSVHSASRMAPTADTPEIQTWIAAGASPDDFCGLPGSGSDHHCPFCRLLADPPEIGLAHRVLRLALVPAWQGFGQDQTRGPQLSDPSIRARGPPATA